MNDCAIARATGIPRGTIRDWRTGGGPRFDRHYPLNGESLVPRCAWPAYAYLFGLYLGDGCLSEHRRDVYRLRITLDGIYPEIVEECRLAIEAVLPNSAAVHPTSSRAVEVNAYSKALPYLFPQHGPGPKHKRPIKLAQWQAPICARHPRRLIRGLIQSDGCRFTNWTISDRGKRYEYPRYTFTNHWEDIRRIFCDHLDMLGIAWRQMNAVNISVARREAVARLDEFVGPKT
jgi:hypothetical protein